MTRIKKLAQEGKEIVYAGGGHVRYKFNPTFKDRIKKAYDKGESLAKVHKTNATMKKSKKKQMKRSSKNKKR